VLQRIKSALVVAPHPDDETLGVGGTLARLTRIGARVTVVTVSEHSPPLVNKSTRQQTREEAAKAHQVLGVHESLNFEHEALELSRGRPWELSQRIASIVATASPEVVLIPFFDRNVDHRYVFECCLVACRPTPANARIEVLAAYETPSSTTWNAPHIEPAFQPTVYVDISSTLETKLQALACYESQAQSPPGPRSTEAVRALAVVRGSEAGVHFAEAFQLVRGCW